MAVRYGIVKMMKVAKVGTIMPWSGDGNEGFSISNIPKGWIVCGGQLEDAARYPLLTSHLGTTYGSDNNFAGDFPEYEGKIRIPNMSLKMPIDLEPEYLLETDYQYGQSDAYNVLVTDSYTGDALVGGFGSISLQAPIPITISANCDIDFTVDATLVLSGKMTNISISPPDFSTTVYTLNRKLGINHMKGHTHPGTYSRTQAQFAGPMPFEPSGISVGGGISGNCVDNFGYSECQLNNPQTAPSWQNGRVQASYYGDEQHEYTLPTTDRFYNFEGSQYWSKVPAQDWPPTDPHPSGLAAATSPGDGLGYLYNGSQYTNNFEVTDPVDTHAQDAWTGLFPKPIEVANRRNYFGPVANYDPETSPPFVVANVTITPGANSITLPAGSDIGAEYELDDVLPQMWVYGGSIRPGTQVVRISRESGDSQETYVYKLELSQPTSNAVTETNIELNFKHGTYPTTTNNLTAQLDPNSSTFLGHNHGSFEISQSKGSLQAPATFPVNNISMGTVTPDNIDNALNIIAEVSMPALICTFIIKAY